MKQGDKFLHEKCGEVQIEFVHAEKFPSSTTWILFASTQTNESWSQSKTAFVEHTKPLTR